jgi:hypothetical protein
MKKSIVVGVSLVALVFATAANAADLPRKAPIYKAPPPPLASDIIKANNQVSLDFVETYIDYGPEHVNGGPSLDSEKGWVPGLSATGSLMRDVGRIQNVYLWGRFSWVDGNTHYWASGGPVTSNTDGATVYDFDFRLGKGFILNPKVMLTPYLGIGRNSWTRLLNGPFGYKEVYSHDYAGSGLLLQYSPAPRWVLSANGLIGGAFNSSMTASQTITNFPGLFATYPLGNKVVYMAGGSVDYAVTEHWHGNAGIDYVHFAYGQSPVNAGGFLEPNSTTNYVKLSVGLGYAW